MIEQGAGYYFPVMNWIISPQNSYVEALALSVPQNVTI